MKLSNIILSSLIGSISLAIIAGSLQLRLTGELKSYNAPANVDTIGVAPFRNLVIHKAWNLTIMPGDEPGIVILGAADGMQPKIHYHTSGDTLHIDSIGKLPPGRGFWMSIHTPDGLGQIRGQHASFTLMDYNGDELAVNLDDSRFTMNAKGTSTIGRLQITGKNGSVFIANRVAFDTVTVDLLASQATINDEIDKLRGSIKHGSSLSAPRAADIQLQKDAGSSWRN